MPFALINLAYLTITLDLPSTFEFVGCPFPSNGTYQLIFSDNFHVSKHTSLSYLYQCPTQASHHPFHLSINPEPQLFNLPRGCSGHHDFSWASHCFCNLPVLFWLLLHFFGCRFFLRHVFVDGHSTKCLLDPIIAAL